ncbi:MAG TPA: HAD family hydrolase [Thermoplasmatales archaeon]|nr:HAD family hydrolase [Thermoplasmatales archaeon]
MKAFLFDLDGTLIKSKDVISEIINETLAEFGYAPFTQEEMLASVGMPLEKLFSLKADEKVVPEMCRRYVEKYLKKGLKKTEPYEKVVNLLKELKDAKTKIGVVTTKSEEEAKKVIEHFGLTPYVDVVVGHNHRWKPKPEPDPILFACSKLSIPPDKTVMIGDANVDIEAGKHAGTFATIGVLWGIGSKNDLKDADYLVHTPMELKSCIQKIKNQLNG